MVISHKDHFSLCPTMPHSAPQKKIVEVMLIYKNAESSGALWGYSGAVNGVAA
jgi:hypothetical protein